MPSVDVRGVPMYYERHGSGEPVLALHGGFCSIEHMRSQIDSLATRFDVVAPERPGHGRTPDTPGPITYATSVADVLAFMDSVGLTDPHIVGFSDGAIIGLLIALDHPGRCRSVVSISGNLHPSGFVVSDTETPTEPDTTPGAERAMYERLSPDGPAHADVVLDKLWTLWTTEPDIDPALLGGLTVPVLVIAGDRDVVRLEHSETIAFSVPDGQLCIVPGATHDLLSERPELVNIVVRDFIRDKTGN